MTHFEAKMHHIRLKRSSDHLAGLQGFTPKGKGEYIGDERGGEKEGKVRNRKEGE